MKRQHKTIFLAMSFILIPVFFWLTPLNYIHKLGSGCPLHPVKNALKSNLCQNRFSAPEPRSDSAALPCVTEHIYAGALSTSSIGSGYEPIRIDFSLKDPPLRC
jgi:hypothetical protein